jgi:hypothetical protein
MFYYSELDWHTYIYIEDLLNMNLLRNNQFLHFNRVSLEEPTGREHIARRVKSPLPPLQRDSHLLPIKVCI